MSNQVKVAAIQMNCILGNKQANLEKAKKLVEEAIQQGAKLIVLPELFNTGYRVEERDVELAESIPGLTTDWMSEFSVRSGIYLVGCTLERGEADGVTVKYF